MRLRRRVVSEWMLRCQGSLHALRRADDDRMWRRRCRVCAVRHRPGMRRDERHVHVYRRIMPRRLLRGRRDVYSSNSPVAHCLRIRRERL
jgi:hypothetical protein